MFEMDSTCGTPCPHCGQGLSAVASWECDSGPYPHQELECPACGKLLVVSQQIVTVLEKRYRE